jgi:acetyl-CoA carboxylase biotin carboxyl carrier protein
MAKKNQKPTVPNGGNAGVDLREVERLLDFMEKRGLEEFEYERDGVRVHLRKPSAQLPSGSRSMATPENAVYGTPEASRAIAPGDPAPVRENAAEIASAENLHVVKSPIVGTFYSSATPAGEPFVSVGSRVEPGQALCIIEAMKLMNEIEADVAGEVVKIFVENGQPVEYGEPLFGINPRKK